MEHPRMYSDDDPYLADLRTICLALPEAVELETFGRPTFRAGKIFAWFTGTDDHPCAVAVLPDPAERAALAEDPRFYLPPYLAPRGWIALDLQAAEVDWTEVAELVESSYRRIALKRMLRALDGPCGPGR